MCKNSNLSTIPEKTYNFSSIHIFVLDKITEGIRKGQKNRATKFYTIYIYKTATSVTTISKITNARLKENADNYYSTPILIRKPFPHSRRRKNSVDTREKSKFQSSATNQYQSTSNTSQSYKDNISREATFFEKERKKHQIQQNLKGGKKNPLRKKIQSYLSCSLSLHARKTKHSNQFECGPNEGIKKSIIIFGVNFISLKTIGTTAADIFPSTIKEQPQTTAKKLIVSRIISICSL